MRRVSMVGTGADDDGRFHVLRAGGGGRLRSLLQPACRLHGRLRGVVSLVAGHQLAFVRRSARRQSATHERSLYRAPVSTDGAGVLNARNAEQA